MRVVIADDNLLVREGIAALLAEAGIEVAARGGDADELLAAVDAHAPDVAIVDIRMPPTHTDEGLRAAHAIRARHPRIGIVSSPSTSRSGIATRLLAESPEGSATCSRTASTDVDDFVGALRRVAAGGSALDPQVVSGLLARRRDDGPLAGAHAARARGARSWSPRAAPTRAIAERLVITRAQRREARLERSSPSSACPTPARAPPRPRRAARTCAPEPGRPHRPTPGGPPPGHRRTARGGRRGRLALAPHAAKGSPCSRPSSPSSRPTLEPAAVVTARDVVRRYGEGDTAVDALRGVSVDIAARPPHRRHGPVGLRQVDADAHPRRPRPAHVGRGHGRRRRHHAPRRRRAHAAAPRPHRLHLPVLQPAADAHGGREHRAAAQARRRQAGPGVARRARRHGRPRRAPRRTARRSSPAASSSASPSPARSSRGRA